MNNPILIGFTWVQLYDATGLAAGDDLSGAVIHANAVLSDTATEVIAPRAQTDAVLGANWAQNVVAIEFTAGDTAAIAAHLGKTARVQLRVAKGGRTRLYDAGLVPIRAAVFS
jgi:hypothetical protein